MSVSGLKQTCEIVLTKRTVNCEKLALYLNQTLNKGSKAMVNDKILIFEGDWVKS